MKKICAKLRRRKNPEFGRISEFNNAKILNWVLPTQISVKIFNNLLFVTVLESTDKTAENMMTEQVK